MRYILIIVTILLLNSCIKSICKLECLNHKYGLTQEQCKTICDDF